ncbi:peptidase domain protein [Caldicellulosiruptor acetigenus I77R1B]|uniref:Peptidase domain protein n=1 Tax=Caldicellulosiruptor acetigenus (strain ATCC 700853 / DSM 12137 / I77R1B) TaxID=632335 RepID=E4S4S6_CALA7|nr:amidase domain-containing protein [Caldicellulosiruptor acetigenus]ADQ40445.1 peptidase domain protein [Caldicellulosiruptor acetigenus I77R1B]
MKKVFQKLVAKFLIPLIAFSLILWYNENTFAAVKDESENNNSFSTANSISCGDLIRGYIWQQINPSQDKDYFKIYFNAGKTVVINFINAHPKVDYNIYLYNSSQQLITSSTNPTGKNEFISYSVLSSGYYYILVSSSYGYSGSAYYSLQVLKSIYTNSNSTNINYNRAGARSYALKYAISPNPKYADFSNYGGDCTNFASQVLFEGGGLAQIASSTSGIESDTNYWFYKTSTNRSTSWTGAEEFRRHWGNSNGFGKKRAYQIKILPVWYAVEKFKTEVYDFLKEGDIVQHVNAYSSTYGRDASYHSQIVHDKKYQNGIYDILYAQHSVSSEGFYSNGSLYDYLVNSRLNNPDENKRIGWIILYKISSN